MVFSFGAPLKPEQFFDREEELGLVTRRVLGIRKGARNDVVLIGPRRVGKSSVLSYLSYSLPKHGVYAVQVDCEGLNLVSFLKAYGNAVVQSDLERKGIEARLGDLLKRGVSDSIAALAQALGAVKAVELSYSTDFLRFRLELERLSTAKALSNKEVEELFTRTIELPERTDGKKAVLFDEFQETREYSITQKADFYARIRALTQRHSRTAYVYTGSAIGLVQEIFGNPENPFAGNAEMVYLKPFSPKTCVDFLEKNFKSHDKRVDAQANEVIYKETRGFPAYLNWVGLKCVDIAGGKRVVDGKIALLACSQMLSPLSPLKQMIEKQLAKLGANTVKVLRSIASGHDKPVAIARESGAKNVHVYLTRLQQYGLVQEEAGAHAIVDPLLERYLKIT